MEQTHHRDKGASRLCRLSDIPAPPHTRRIDGKSLPYKAFPSADTVGTGHGTAIA